MSKSLLNNIETYQEGDETKLMNPAAGEMKSMAK